MKSSTNQLLLIFLFFLSVFPVTMKDVFPNGKEEESEDILTIAAVGDLMMGGRVLPFLKKFGSDYPFDSTRSLLMDADLAVANLEAPFTRKGEAAEKTYTFKVPPEYSGAIVLSGIDVLTLANNHILDFGVPGLTSTLHTLDSLGLFHCGAGIDQKSAEIHCLVQKNGWNVAFLAFSMTYPETFWASGSRGGTAYPRPSCMVSCIRDAKEAADLVIVSFHWGGERMTVPREYQVRFAHDAVDAGADLILGHHPHVIQGLEVYRSKLIAYSLGNYVFGSYGTGEGLLLQVRFDRRGWLDARAVPLNVQNHTVSFQPSPMRGKALQHALDKLKALSGALGGILDSSGWIRLEPSVPDS